MSSSSFGVTPDAKSDRPAIRVDDRRVAIGDVAGGVRVVDVLTGAEIWHAQIAEQLSAPLVADSRVVVAFEQIFGLGQIVGDGAQVHGLVHVRHHATRVVALLVEPP